MKLQFIKYLALFFLMLVVASCEKGSETFGTSDTKNSPSGKSGSTARITIAGDYLYAVDVSSLKVVNISDPQNPFFVRTVQVGRNIETIYPFKNYLFIGSTDGMFIYSMVNPENPTQMSQFSHITSCDPVIADDSLAFVTLRNTEICNRMTDTREIQVLDILDVTNPILKSTYITDFPPYGLDMDADYLYVCHGKDGFAIYDKNKVINNIYNAMIKRVTGINAYDAILYSNILFIIGESGFHQYDYSDINNPVLLSSILAGK
jgi:hypothetical protein